MNSKRESVLDAAVRVMTAGMDAEINALFTLDEDSHNLMNEVYDHLRGGQ